MNNKKLVPLYLIGLIPVGYSQTTIAAQSQHMLMEVKFHLEPCDIPDHAEKYAPFNQLLRAAVSYPKAAMAARVGGSAGAEFQLDATGTPRNIKLVCEKPTGYGFGQALLEALKQEKFKPSSLPDQSPPLPDQWYYDAISLGVDN